MKGGGVDSNHPVFTCENNTKSKFLKPFFTTYGGVQGLGVP